MLQGAPQGPPDSARPGRGTAVPPTDAPAADRTSEDLQADAVERALSSTGAYGAMLYLRSRDGRSLVLSTIAGVPAAALQPFRRISVLATLPAPLAYRSGRTVHLSGAEETMRRFPQMLAGLPYSFASAYTPVIGGRQTFGVLCLLWPAAPDGVPLAARRQLRHVARKLGGDLVRLADAGGAVAEGNVLTELPWPAAPPVRLGLFCWDLDSAALEPDDETRELFGLGDLSGADLVRAAAAAIDPVDLPRVRRALRRAARTGEFRPLQLRLRAEGGRMRTLQAWGWVRAGERRLLGAVLDVGTAPVAVQAVERMRQGLFSLDPAGRVDYANLGCELLLGVRREDLLGRSLAEALPWLADPLHEDRYRAAVISRRPAAFVACRPPDHWLAVSLYPDAHGMTGTVVPQSRPSGTPARPAPPAPPVGAIYHLLQLGSALAEAVSVREVCAVVADQILPAFGGQELAVYVVEANRLALKLQVGYPEGFLDPFEGTPMSAPVPGAETLSSGVPIFFASVEELAGAYPGIPIDQMCSWAFLPLIASGRPVGSCILGFDEPHPFTAEERVVLTALSGLIAQALERARLYDAESELAQGLQHALLPHALPHLAEVDIAARYLPATRGMEIGGDWYDAIVTERGLCLVIGDVEGHSVAAAGVMGQLRSAVRAFVSSGHPPDEVMQHLNQLLTELDPGLLASCCLVEVDPATGLARGVRAGHLPPLLRGADGSARALELGSGMLLGVDPTAEYRVARFALEPGGLLALYTDGLVERPHAPIGHGIDRLRTQLAHADTASLEDLADHLLATGLPPANRADDVVLLLARRPARPARGEPASAPTGPAPRAGQP